LPGGEELVADLPDSLAVPAHHRVGVEVLLGRHRHHQAARDVLRQADDLIGEPSHILLAHVGQQQVDLIVARLRPEALRGAGDAAAVQRLVQVDHLDQLVLHRAGLLHAVVLRCQRRSTDQRVAHAHLAAAVALPVVAREPLHHHAGELILAVEEDVLVGDEHVVQHHQGLLAAELRVAHVDGRVLLQLPGIAALTAVDHVHALGVCRAGEAHRPVLVRLAHGDGGHEDVPVAVDGAGLVALGAADHDAVSAALHHMHVHVRVRLLAGGLGPVALGVGHGAVHRQVVVLDEGQELLEVFVIAGAVLLVDLIGGGEHGVERIHTHTPLEAGSGLLAQQALHLHLVNEVLRGLVQVGEAVDGVARQAGLHRHQIGILGVLGQSVGHGHAVDAWPDHGVVHPVLNLLPEHIHPGIQFAQALYILLCGHQCHFFFSSSKKWGSFTFQCVPGELRLPGTPWPAPLGAAPSP
ncbi:D-alanyl-lipoteichoic acid biosynthesis protein DltB, partial [Dysosmobacter welbionis]